MVTKQEVLNNLDKWTLQNNGAFVAFSNFGGIPSYKNATLNSKEEKEVRNAIIEKVRQNPSEWRIERINVEYQASPNFFFDKYGKCYWDIFLIHKSAQIELEKQGRKDEEVLKKVDYGKMHYQRGFSEKEWQELEKLPLGNKETHANIQSDNPQNNFQKNNNSNKGSLWIVSLVVIIILGAVFFGAKIKNWLT